MNMDSHVPGGRMGLGLGVGTSTHLPNGHLDAGKLVRDFRSAPSMSQLHLRSEWDKQATACSHCRQMSRRVVMKSIDIMVPWLNARCWIAAGAVAIRIADNAVAFLVHAGCFIEDFDLQLNSGRVVVDVPDVGADAVIVQFVTEDRCAATGARCGWDAGGEDASACVFRIFVGITIHRDIPAGGAIAIATGNYHGIDVTATCGPRKFDAIALPTWAGDGVAFAVGLGVTTDHAGVPAAWAIGWVPCTATEWNLDGVAHEGRISAAATFLFIAVVDQLPGDADAGLIRKAARATGTRISWYRFLATAFAADHKQTIFG